MADNQQILEILLKITSQQDDLNKVITGLNDTKSATDEASKSAFGFKQAFEFAGAEEALRRTIEFLKEIPAQFLEGVKAGVEFNSEIQNLTTNIAAVLRQTQGQKFFDFDSAKVQAAGIVDVLKDSANAFGKTYSDMFDTYTHSQNVLNSITTDISKQVQLIGTLKGAVASAVPGGVTQAKDIVDILAGMASRTIGGKQLAVGMGFTDAAELDKAIQQAIQAGTVFDFFMTHLAGFKEAIADMAKNFSSDINRMHNSITDLESAVAKPIMQPLTDEIEQLTAALNTAEAQAAARTIGQMIAASMDIALESIKAVANESHSAAGEIAQWAAILNPVSGLWGQILLLKKEVFDSTADVNLANIQVDIIAKQLGLIEKQAEAAHQKADQEKAVAELQQFILSLEQAILANKVKDVQGATMLLEAAKEFLANREQHLGVEKDITSEHLLQAGALEFNKGIADKTKLLEDENSGDKQAAAADKAKLAYDQIYKTAQARGDSEALADVMAQHYADQVERAALKKVDDKDAQKELTEFTREQALALQEVRNAQQLIKDNPFLSVDEKDVLLIPLIGSEIQDLNSKIKDGQEKMAGGTLDPAQYAKVAMEVGNLQTKVTELGFQLSKLSFGGTLQAGLVQWVNSFGSAADQITHFITGTLNTAIGSTSQALTGLIFGTTTWQQAFASAAQSIVGDLIKIALQFVVSRLVMTALNAVAGTSDSATANAQAASASAAWAPAAISASIATEGVAAGAGLAAYLAALAAGEAGAIGVSSVGGGKGYKSGGYTGDGDPNAIAGPAHKKEFYFTADQVDALGLPFLQNLAAAAGGKAVTSSAHTSRRNPSPISPNTPLPAELDPSLPPSDPYTNPIPPGDYPYIYNGAPGYIAPDNVFHPLDGGSPIYIGGSPMPPGDWAPDMPAVPAPPSTSPVDIYGDPVTNPIGDPTVEVPTSPYGGIYGDPGPGLVSPTIRWPGGDPIVDMPPGSAPDMPEVPPPPSSAPVDIYGDPIVDMPPGSAPDMPGVPPPPSSAPVDIYGNPIVDMPPGSAPDAPGAPPPPSSAPVDIYGNPITTGIVSASAPPTPGDLYALFSSLGYSLGPNVDFGTAHFDGGALYAGMVSGRGSAQLARGGFIFGGSGVRDDVHILGMGGEFMQSKPAVDHYGVDFMHALNNRQISIPQLRMSAGGLVGAASSGSGAGRSQQPVIDVHVYHFNDERAAIRAYQQSPEQRKFFRRSMANNRS